MPWYLNPSSVCDLARGTRLLLTGGGPGGVRLHGLQRPSGWVLPSSSIGLELYARDGSSERFRPEFPVPAPLALGWRLASGLGVPIVSELDPEELDLTVGGAAR